MSRHVMSLRSPWKTLMSRHVSVTSRDMSPTSYDVTYFLLLRACEDMSCHSKTQHRGGRLLSEQMKEQSLIASIPSGIRSGVQYWRWTFIHLWPSVCWNVPREEGYSQRCTWSWCIEEMPHSLSNHLRNFELGNDDATTVTVPCIREVKEKPWGHLSKQLVNDGYSPVKRVATTKFLICSQFCVSAETVCN